MVRVAIKESSFCIVEFSLSPISKFIHSPNYVATTSFQALVLTIGGDPVFHCDPLRPTVYSLWNRYCGASVLRADKTRTSRIRFSIAVLSIPCYFIDGRYYPQSVRRTAVLSCDSKVHPTSSFLVSPHLNFRAANRVVCWLYLINRKLSHKSFNYLQSFYVQDRSCALAFRLSSLCICGLLVSTAHSQCLVFILLPLVICSTFHSTTYLSGVANRTVRVQSRISVIDFPFFFVFYSGVYARAGAVPLGVLSPPVPHL